MDENHREIVQESQMRGSLLFAIFVVLLVLKITGTVAWAWWIIFLPLWLPFVIFLVVGSVLAIGYFIALGTVKAIRLLRMWNNA